MSTQLKILVGLIFTLLTCLPLGYVALNDLSASSKEQPSGMEQRASALAGRQIEAGADSFGQYCSPCHGKKGEGIPQVAPAINRKDLLDGRREKQVSWTGSIESFIKNAIAAGRPIASRSDLYAAHMPTWGGEYGGPLRPDQVDALVAFVLNWKDQAPEVDAWPAVAVSGTPLPPPTPGPTPTTAPQQAGLAAVCVNLPAQYAGKKPTYKFDDKAIIAAGKVIYDDKCAACHGVGGKGDGVAAVKLNPKPANLTDKNFMKTLPVDCHFFVVSEGVKGTGMPPWKALGEDVIWKVLIYERSFSGVQ